ncbi:MAG: AMP-binding protein [Alphaproteobacteria bacterium]|nr:AMP-binding protein [Alphaproteobacteria bacterium]MCZ6765268.1 AMP-binding protein [Alphaproteobacteria bacterium]
MSKNLYELFQSRFPANRSSVFMETEAGRIFSYGDLDAEVAATAAALTALGALPGDRVAAQVEKSPEAVFLYLACLKAGLIFLPLNPAYADDEVAYFVGDAEPLLFVCVPGREDDIHRLSGAHKVMVMSLGQARDGSFAVHTTEFAGGVHDTAVCAADDVAAILYTSGTTGRPKGAMITHGNLASNALALHEVWGFKSDDVLLHALPIFHVHGLFVALNTTLVGGTGLLFLERFSPDAVMAHLPHATVFMGVPTYYTRLLARAEFDGDLCANMRLFISGSAPLLEETFAAFETRTGHRILERYGMTETGMNTSNPLDGERLPGTVGFPLPGIVLRVVGDDGKTLGAGEIGVLQLTGPNVFKGYWRMPEKTEEDFTDDGFFVTGDMATIDETGRAAIVGRAKDLIISGGLNVYPKEIEALIDEIEGVVESAVVGAPDDDFGEQVVAFIVAEGGAVNEAAVMAALSGRLARYKRPKAIRFVGDLPRNAMGKVQKNLLRDDFAAE